MFRPLISQPTMANMGSPPIVSQLAMTHAKRHSRPHYRANMIEQQLALLDHILRQNRARLETVRKGLSIHPPNMRCPLGTAEERKLWFIRTAPIVEPEPEPEPKEPKEPGETYIHIQDLRGHGPLFAKSPDNLKLQYDALSELCDLQTDVFQQMRENLKDIQTLKNDTHAELRARAGALSSDVDGLQARLNQANEKVVELRGKWFRAEREAAKLRVERMKWEKSTGGTGRDSSHESKYILPLLFGCVWGVFTIHMFISPR